MKKIITAATLNDEAPRNCKKTAWHNPTGSHLVAEVYVSPPRTLAEGIEGEDGRYAGRRVEPACWARCEWEPGETLSIPSEYDRAIHTLDRAGNVVGGLAPQLRRVGAPEPIFAAGIGGR
ncbi:MAG TPA: hypothetical protein VF316_25450 [Polyangiaceae bacterium]